MSLAKYDKALGCLLVFCLSSQWLYMNGIAPLMLMSAALVILIGLCVVASKLHRVSLESLSIGITLLYANVLFLGLFSLAISGGEPDLKRIFGVVILILFGLMARQIFRQDILNTAIKFVLSVHILFLILQQIFYFAFDFLIDYQVLMGFPDSAMRSNTFVYGKEVKRFGGLYDEPGTFAVHIGPLLLLLIAKRARTKSDQILILSGILSLCLTFSTYAAIAILGALLIEIANRFRSKNAVKKGTLINISIILAGLFVSFLIILKKRFFLRQTFAEESGVSYRLNTINYFTQKYEDDPWIGIIGAGVFDKNSIFFVNDASDIILNDTSLIFFILISGGLPLCIILITYFWAKLYRNWSYGVITGFILLSKLSLFSIYAVFLLISCLELARQNNK